MMVRPIAGPRICVFSINVTNFRRAIFHNSRGSLTQIVTGETPNRDQIGVRTDLLPAMLFERISSNVPHEPFDFIGISFTGPVTDSGVVLRGPNIWGPNIVNVRLAEMVSKKTGIKTIVINDVTATAWREKLFGQAKALDEFRVITVSEGLGSKVFRDGKVIVGADGQAGEIGHLEVESGLKLECGCGGFDHLELFAARNAAKRLAPEMSVEQIAAAAQAGDPFTLALIETICRPLAKTIGQIHQKDPVKRYLITGDFAFGVGQPYFNTLREQVDSYSPGLGNSIIPGTDDVNSGLIGAGAAILASL